MKPQSAAAPVYAITVTVDRELECRVLRISGNDQATTNNNNIISCGNSCIRLHVDGTGKRNRHYKVELAPFRKVRRNQECQIPLKSKHIFHLREDSNAEG